MLSPGRDGRGHLRFGFVDLVLLRTMRGLLERRVPLRQIARVLTSLRRQIGHRPLTKLSIYADGRRVVAWDGESRWQPESGQFMFNFDASQVVRRARRIAQLPTPPPKAGLPRLSADEWCDLAMELEDTAAWKHAPLSSRSTPTRATSSPASTSDASSTPTATCAAPRPTTATRSATTPSGPVANLGVPPRTEPPEEGMTATERPGAWTRTWPTPTTTWRYSTAHRLVMRRPSPDDLPAARRATTLKCLPDDRGGWLPEAETPRRPSAHHARPRVHTAEPRSRERRIQPPGLARAVLSEISPRCSPLRRRARHGGINNTFYRLPTSALLPAGPSEPAGLGFALKAPQRITHQLGCGPGEMTTVLHRGRRARHARSPSLFSPATSASTRRGSATLATLPRVDARSVPRSGLVHRPDLGAARGGSRSASRRGPGDAAGRDRVVRIPPPAA